MQTHTQPHKHKAHSCSHTHIYTCLNVLQGEIGPDGEMIARVNGEDITANLSSVNDTYITMSVMLERIAEDTVSVSFMSSISLEMSLREGTLTSLLKIPSEFNGTVIGLLGNFDGDDTNDLMYRNGTIASDDIPDREKHVLGQTCEFNHFNHLFAKMN